MRQWRKQTTVWGTLVGPEVIMNRPYCSHTANHFVEACLGVLAKPYLVSLVGGRCMIPIEVVEVTTHKDMSSIEHGARS